VIEYIGFQIHKEDIENAVTDALSNPKPILGQKFDLEAYEKDGTYILFVEAFRKNLTRYSYTFMMEKHFGKDKKE